MEAISFLDTYPWKAISNNLYVFEDLALSFTGEGLFDAIYGLESAISKLGKINKITHYGLCGALNDSIKLESILSIRSCYRQKNSTDMDFTSFTTADEKATYDIATAIDRVDDSKEKEYLAQFASLVDRETWAYAYICQKHKIPFYAYKIVSDFADQKLCSQIKNKAEDFSFSLLQHFQTNNDVSVYQLDEISYPEGFYFTASLKADFSNKLKQLAKKLDISPNEALNEISYIGLLKLDIPSKQKTKLFIQKIEKKLDPDFYLWREELRSFINDYKERGLNLSFGKFFEPSEGEIRFSFKNPEEFHKKIGLLKEVDLDRVFKAQYNESK